MPNSGMAKAVYNRHYCALGQGAQHVLCMFVATHVHVGLELKIHKQLLAVLALRVCNSNCRRYP